MAKQLSGIRAFNTDVVNDLIDLVGFSVASAELTALAGGGRPGATPLQPGFNSVTVVATAADSCVLPVATKGTMVFVRNSDSADSMTVFALGSDTINGTAGATGVTHSAGLSAIYWCPVDTKWFRLLSA